MIMIMIMIIITTYMSPVSNSAAVWCMPQLTLTTVLFCRVSTTHGSVWLLSLPRPNCHPQRECHVTSLQVPAATHLTLVATAPTVHRPYTNA